MQTTVKDVAFSIDLVHFPSTGVGFQGSFIDQLEIDARGECSAVCTEVDELWSCDRKCAL